MDIDSSPKIGHTEEEKSMEIVDVMEVDDCSHDQNENFGSLSLVLRSQKYLVSYFSL